MSKGTFNSFNRECIHRISAAVAAWLLDLASALDIATRGCFLDHQETNSWP